MRSRWVAAALTGIFVAMPSQAGLIAHWKFDESSGGTASDSAGSLDGTLAGAASFAPGSGIDGGAILLDRSTGDLVNMGNVLAVTGDFSLVGWVKMNAGDQTQSFLASRHQAGSVNGYFLSLNADGTGGEPDKAAFYNSSSFDSHPQSTTSVNDGSWHQVVGVYDSGGNAQIFIDGILEDTRTASPIGANTGPFLVGGITISGGSVLARYDGLIDDVRVYDHALSGTEVQQLYVAFIPEPSTALLLCSGLLGVGAARRRRLG